MTTVLKLLEGGKNSVLEKSIEILKTGGLVIFPSDTVYGLFVDATNEKAVDKLIQFKNRPPGKPISVFVSDIDMLYSQVSVDVNAEKLLQELLPGPFTVILESQHKVSSRLESEKRTLGVRIPNDPFVTELVNKLGVPVTATSANIAGRSPHYSIDSLLKDLSQGKKELIDLVVDAGKLPRNKPSTIVDLTKSSIKIVRHGDIDTKDSKTFITKTSTQTQKIARFITEKLVQKNRSKPLVFILEGDLGSGKTVFVKGAAEIFDITNIISPTFVVYYEYEIASQKFQPKADRPLDEKVKSQKFNKFYHFDLYNIEEESEFDHLGIDNVLKEKNIIFIEWGEKLGTLYEKFKEKADVVHININYISEKGREIRVSY